jgi:hypothetical protein
VQFSRLQPANLGTIVVMNGELHTGWDFIPHKTQVCAGGNTGIYWAKPFHHWLLRIGPLWIGPLWIRVSLNKPPSRQ